jgi:hypothetical protein
MANDLGWSVRLRLLGAEVGQGISVKPTLRVVTVDDAKPTVRIPSLALTMHCYPTLTLGNGLRLVLRLEAIVGRQLPEADIEGLRSAADVDRLLNLGG